MLVMVVFFIAFRWIHLSTQLIRLFLLVLRLLLMPSLYQAEDGIRYLPVTGVQTCALPISQAPHRPGKRRRGTRSRAQVQLRAVPRPRAHGAAAHSAAGGTAAGLSARAAQGLQGGHARSEEHTSELPSQSNIVCRLLLEKKK